MYKDILKNLSLTKNAEAGAGSEGAADRGRPAPGMGVPGKPFQGYLADKKPYHLRSLQ